MGASIVEHFGKLRDPRIERHKKHRLEDIIVLSICAVLSGAEGWEAIRQYGQAKLAWLRQFIVHHKVETTGFQPVSFS